MRGQPRGDSAQLGLGAGRLRELVVRGVRGGAGGFAIAAGRLPLRPRQREPRFTALGGARLETLPDVDRAPQRRQRLARSPQLGERDAGRRQYVAEPQVIASQRGLPDRQPLAAGNQRLGVTAEAVEVFAAVAVAAPRQDPFRTIDTIVDGPRLVTEIDGGRKLPPLRVQLGECVHGLRNVRAVAAVGLAFERDGRA